ncbi:hypothetical protein E2C01_069311 [Portunus trituberculatus]|uniref:Uncharacterized protein n=1 Tax=Portunus trituberculatus TaxID=210409 RepID=A0A5B7HPQ9_PORTR|nr:hypothetical protein [Portunus trituberculatus]
MVVEGKPRVIMHSVRVRTSVVIYRGKRSEARWTRKKVRRGIEKVEVEEEEEKRIALQCEMDCLKDNTAIFLPSLL